jgi:hypothetical protein
VFGHQLLKDWFDRRAPVASLGESIASQRIVTGTREGIHIVQGPDHFFGLRKEFNNVTGEHAVDSMQVHNIEGGELRKLRAGNTVPEEADGGIEVRALNDRVVNPGCDSVPRGGKRLGSQVPVDDVVEICVVSLSRLLVLEDFCHGTGTARAGKVHVKNRSGHSTTLVGNV